jgi:hypothetical protein
MDGSAGRTHTTRTAHTFSLTPRLLLLSADFAPHPPWVKRWAPVGALSGPTGGEDSHSLSVPTDLGEDQPGHMIFTYCPLSLWRHKRVSTVSKELLKSRVLVMVMVTTQCAAGPLRLQASRCSKVKVDSYSQ